MTSKSIVLWFCLAAAAQADTRITARYTSAGQTSENTIYTHGQRQRMEVADQAALIQQPDLQRVVDIDNKAKTYEIVPVSDGNVAASASVRSGGVVTTTTTITDTGERKQMFGYEARHLKTVMLREPGPGACDAKKQRVEADGWYIDLEVPKAQSPESTATAPGGCRDEYRAQQSGNGKPGYPLQYTLTTADDNDKPVTVAMQVVDLVVTPQDPALFEIPAGYREVKQVNGVAVAFGPKAKGATRVGVAGLNGKPSTPVPVGAYQAQLIGYLASPSIETMPVAGATRPEIEQNARQAECDYILYTDLGEPKKPGPTGKLGMLGRGVASLTKESSEAHVDYQLYAAGNAEPVLTSAAASKTGGGFNVRAAMQVASTVGSIAASHYMMMNPAMMLLASRGGATHGMTGLDPGLSSLMYMFQAQSGGQRLGPESAPVGAALEKEAKAVLGFLNGNK